MKLIKVLSVIAIIVFVISVSFICFQVASFIQEVHDLDTGSQIPLDQ